MLLESSSKNGTIKKIERNIYYAYLFQDNGGNLMERFGGLFGVFLIVVVTAAQLAGNRKRNRDKEKDEDSANDSAE